MMIHLKRLPIYLTFAAFILVPFAYAQNVTCATRPAGDNTNACASTSFVQTAVKSGSGGITVGTTTITGGTSGRILYDNAGVVGEYTLSGLTANLPLIGNTTGIAQGTRSGNTTTFVTTTGTLTSGRCVEIDANGNFVQASAACGGSGGTPGGSNTQLQYNAAGSFGGITGATSDGTNVTLTSPRITTDIRPSSNDGASLGISGTAFADLFLASGGVINWNAGALTLTEGSGLTQSANTNSTTSYTLNNSNTGASAVSRFIAQTGTGNSFLTMQVHDNSGSPFAQIVGGSALSNLRVNIGGGIQASWDANGTTSTAFIPNGSTVPSIGMYLPGASTLGWAVSSVAEVQLTSGAFSPVTSNGSTLGTSTLGWGDLHLHANGTVNWSNGSVSIGHISADDSLRFASATGGYQFSNFIAPSTTDGAALGSTSLMWSDLFLASGGVINWNNGNATLTHSTNLLTSNRPIAVGVAGSILGSVAFNGNTSGTVTVRPAAAAGTWTMTLPTSGGTNGYFLQTNGSGVTSWAAAGGGSGGITQIATTATTSGTAVNFTNIPATYAYLILDLTGVSSNTSSSVPYVQVSTNNGSSYDTTNSNYVRADIRSDSVSYYSTAIPSLMHGFSLTSANTTNIRVYIYGYQGGTSPKADYYSTEPATPTTAIGTGYYLGSTSAVDALRIIFANSSTFDAGTATLYGVN